MGDKDSVSSLSPGAAVGDGRSAALVSDTPTSAVPGSRFPAASRTASLAVYSRQVDCQADMPSH